MIGAKGIGRHTRSHKDKGLLTSTDPIDPTVTNAAGSPTEQQTDPVQSHSVDTDYVPRVHSAQLPLNQQDFGHVQIKDRLRLPPAKSKEWKKIDKAAKSFPNPTAECDLNEYQEQLDAQIYQLLNAQFGTLKSSPTSTSRPTAPPKDDAKVQREITRLKKTARRLWKDRDRWAASADTTSLSKVIRLDRQLKRLQAKIALKRHASDDQRDFQHDSHRYATNLFQPKTNKSPTFDKATADEFFRTTYQDTKREQPYTTPPPGLQRPPPPTHQFNVEFPSVYEVEQAIWKKPNRSSPGINGIPYVVYKRCPELRSRLIKIVQLAWSSWTALRSWQLAKVVLIAKSNSLDMPKEFRPIALLNATGKIFFSIANRRLERFMTNNNYLRIDVQKGFRTGVPGCIENVAQITEALNVSKEEHRPVCMSFVDLENAYGTVRHNLIQWALWWYHVPERFANLIFSYYSRQAAIVISERWITDWFQYGTGTMQGCTIAAMLFNVSFNPILETFDLPHHRELGFLVSPGSKPINNKNYADDVTLITAEPSENQILLNALEAALNWTGSMRAKPAKCRSLALRTFTPSYVGQFKPAQQLIHSSYDPGLTIRGEPIRFIGQDGQPFKFLGRLISHDLRDDFARRRITDTLDELLTLVNNRPLRGWQKVWLYNFFVAPKLCWMLMIYELPLTFVEQLEATCTRYLKQWFGLSKCTVPDILYAERQHHGFQLHAMATFYRRMQLVRVHLLKYSPDPELRALYSRLAAAPRDHRLKWNAIDALELHEASLQNQRALNEQQRSHAGVGASKLGSKLSELDSQSGMRDAISKRERIQSSQQRLEHLRQLEMQGLWADWDSTWQVDMSWRALFTGAISDAILKFCMNAQCWTLPTDDNKHRWNLTPVSRTCILVKPSDYPVADGAVSTCAQPNPSGKHVLSTCKIALEQGRYTWRHNSVLNATREILQIQIDRINSHEVSLTSRRRRTDFVRENGEAYKPDTAAPNPPPETLADHIVLAHDWKLLADLPDVSDKRYTAIPPEIVPSPLRPDMLLISNEARIMVILELTCPIEERLDTAHESKQEKYKHLVDEGRTRDWRIHVHCFEVGVRGVTGPTTRNMFRAFGFPRSKEKLLLQTLSDVALRCSYWLFLNRHNPMWEVRPLLGFPRTLLDTSPTNASNVT